MKGPTLRLTAGYTAEHPCFVRPEPIRVDDFRARRKTVSSALYAIVRCTPSTEILVEPVLSRTVA